MEVKLLSGALGAEITGINLKDSSKKNYEILKNNTNFEEYLDLRNFHEKTIRAK